MEDIADNLESHNVCVVKIMTSFEKDYMNEFLSIYRSSDVLPKLANSLTSDLDVFIKIIRHKEGLNRFMKIFGVSHEVNTILFYPITMRFTEIMTHERGYDLATHILNVCNVQHKKQFCDLTYRHALVLARDEKGCVLLKKVISIADDGLKDEFLELVALEAHLLSHDDLGISLIQHMLKIDFTLKTTQDDTRLHGLMAEFDEIFSTCDHPQFHKLTSDSDLFVEFVKTRRGTLMVQMILGKSEEIDTVFLAAIKHRFVNVMTDHYSAQILFRTLNIFKKRGNSQVYHQILCLIGIHAFDLIKDPFMGNHLVQHVLSLSHMDFTSFIASGLHRHYIELSFMKHGSKIVEKILGDGKMVFPLVFIVMEIVECDKDTLVRLAKDEYGNNVLRKTLEIVKGHRVEFFGDLVKKLKPFLDSLRGSRGENIVAMIDSETEMIKDRIVSQGNG